MGRSVQMADAWLCDPLVSGLPGACAPESPTASAEKKGRIAPEIAREVWCPQPLSPGAWGEADWELSLIHI